MKSFLFNHATAIVALLGASMTATKVEGGSNDARLA
jgi:hypothetical protein